MPAPTIRNAFGENLPSASIVLDGLSVTGEKRFVRIAAFGQFEEHLVDFAVAFDWDTPFHFVLGRKCGQCENRSLRVKISNFRVKQLILSEAIFEGQNENRF